MDFLTLAKERYSVRSFRPDPVPDEIVDKILEAGLVAPTACNNQPEKILVIRGEEALEKLRRVTECHFGAPLAFLVSYDKNLIWKRKYDGRTSGDVDASIVATHMMLGAWSLGIGSTWVMYFIPEAAKCEFDLPDTVEPVALLVMGYPADDTAPSRMHTAYREKKEIVSEA